ncbi:DUF515 domain-containing protein [Methanocaldococcus sp. 10A]
MVDISKIRTLKEKSKGRKPKSNLMPIVIIIIVISFVALLILTVPSIIETFKQEKILTMQSFEKTKSDAIQQINTMFSKYPSDPMKNTFIAKIQTAKNEEEIRKVVDEASRYIKLKEYKKSVINNIKNYYGEFYNMSTLAQETVFKIQAADSLEEVNKIYEKYMQVRDSDLESLESQYREKLLRDIYNIIDTGNIFYLKSEKQFITKKQILNILTTADINELENIKNNLVIPSKLNKVSLVISPNQLPNLPKKGEILNIYNNNGTLITSALVDRAYVLVKNVQYSESKSVDSSVSRYDTSIKKSANSNIQYSINDIPGILHATVIGRLDYNKIVQMFENYGYRLNELEQKTQILDIDNVKYLLVLYVPQDTVNDLAKQKPENLYISVIMGGDDENS